MKTMLLFLAAAVVARADDAVTIKLYEDKAGDVRTVSKVDDMKGNVKFELAGMANEQPNNTKKTLKYTETVVEKAKGADEATKVVRKYQTAETVTNKATKKLPYAGSEVTIAKVKDKYEFTVDGKEMAADDAEDLDKEFNKKTEKVSNKDFLPGKPVKVGDSWDLPIKKLAGSFGGGDKMTIDADKSKGTAKLAKVFDKDGAKWGAIEMKIVLAVKSLDIAGGGEQMATSDGSALKFDVTMEVCIDGTKPGETSKGKFELEISAELPNQGKLAITSKGTVEETDEPVKK